MARKFRKLTNWLQEYAGHKVTLSLADIESILGFKLAPSAYKHAAYWHASETHMLPKAWEEAGWRFCSLDLRGQLVTLNKTGGQVASEHAEVIPSRMPSVVSRSARVPTKLAQHCEKCCVPMRMDKLCWGFETYAAAGERKYTGPSVYFHVKTVERFQALGNSVLRAVEDERFCELLYATLVAWGMHDLRGTRMPDFCSFRSRITVLSPRVASLSGYQITALSEADSSFVMGELWELISELPGTETSSPLVANSKLLHHLLPQLMPPIDRGNTGLFFGYKHQASLQGGRYGQKRIFDYIFSEMMSVSKRMRAYLDSFCYSGFSSSPTKVVDNAIIGFVDEEGLRREAKERKEEKQTRRMGVLAE